MNGLIRKILTGNIPVHEYSTVSVDGAIREKVYLRKDNQRIDISSTHWLLCLDPVVFGVWVANDDPTGLSSPINGPSVLSSRIINTGDPSCQLYFADSSCGDTGMEKKNRVALLDLEYFDRVEEAAGTLLLLRLRRARINHLNPVRSLLLYLKYYKKPNLPFARFKSLASAFSYPRKVSLISYTNGVYYSIFPMDLLGEIQPANRYVFGLRHTNAALAGIMETGKLVVSEVSSGYKDMLYDLGKLHTMAPPPLEELPFSVGKSDLFGFWLPEWVESYKEIGIRRTINLGSHMLLWGECVNENISQVVGSKGKEKQGHLYHIHFLHDLHQREKGFSYPYV